MYIRTHDLRNRPSHRLVNQSEIPKHYAMADAFRPTFARRSPRPQSSTSHGLRSAVVVTDRCGPVGDIVRHGDNGLLFRPGDVDRPRSDLDLLASDDSLRRRMSESSRENHRRVELRAGVEGVKAMLRWVVAGEKAMIHRRHPDVQPRPDPSWKRCGGSSR